MQTKHIVFAFCTLTIFVSLVLVLHRRRLMTLKYAAGWLVLGFIGFMSLLVLWVSEAVPSILGFSYVGLASGFAVVVLLLVSVQLSISISILQRRVEKLAEVIALNTSTEGNHAAEP